MKTDTKINEKWLAVVGYEKYYEVSNLGRVRSLPRVIKRKDGIVRKNPSKIKKLTLNNTGYFIVRLTKINESESKLVHRLVAEAFIKNPKNKPQVNHINAVKTNNLITNLEWNTPYENTHHAIKLNLTPKIFGEKSANSKLSDEEAKRIKYGLRGMKMKSLIKEFGVSKTTINTIRRGDAWKHI